MEDKDIKMIDFNENAEPHTFAKAQEAEVGLTKKREKKRKPDDEDEIDWKQELKSWIFTLGITLVLIFLLKTYVIVNATVPTGSMENTIMPGDNLFGYRLAYINEEPRRGDVIFFYFPDDETQQFVKRIIGLPGETVRITEGKVYITGTDGVEVELEEPYLKEEWTRGTGPFEFHVPEDCYFTMGDNRNNSQDSRFWSNPYVAKDKIIGKAIWTYYPFDRFGKLE